MSKADLPEEKNLLGENLTLLREKEARGKRPHLGRGGGPQSPHRPKLCSLTVSQEAGTVSEEKRVGSS